MKWYGNVLVSRVIAREHTHDMAEEFGDAQMGDVEPMSTFFRTFSGEKHEEARLEDDFVEPEMRRILGPGIKSWHVYPLFIWNTIRLMCVGHYSGSVSLVEDVRPNEE